MSSLFHLSGTLQLILTNRKISHKNPDFLSSPKVSDIGLILTKGHWMELSNVSLFLQSMSSLLH